MREQSRLGEGGGEVGVARGMFMSHGDDTVVFIPTAALLEARP